MFFPCLSRLGMGLPRQGSFDWVFFFKERSAGRRSSAHTPFDEMLREICLHLDSPGLGNGPRANLNGQLSSATL